jgi:tripartite-type tricarboxylate transporter receptor subunit TctC
MMELIAKQEKVEFTHIPYKGATEARTAVLGGHVTIAIGDMGVSLVESEN